MTMTIEDIHQTVMRLRIEQGLAVICAMPDREPVTLYFARPANRDDFMRRAERNGGTVEVAARPG